MEYHRRLTPEIRASAAKTLQDIVGGLPTENFIVRRHRRAVEKYREPKEGDSIDEHKRAELVEEIAPLPSSHSQFDRGRPGRLHPNRRRSTGLSCTGRAGGSPAEYGAGMKLAIDRGWLWMHESGLM